MAAGVRQLICIVRAMVQGPQCHLVRRSQYFAGYGKRHALEKISEKQKGSHAMVLVTHRPSLLLLADKTYTLIGGKLVEVIWKSTNAKYKPPNRP